MGEDFLAHVFKRRFSGNMLSTTVSLVLIIVLIFCNHIPIMKKLQPLCCCNIATIGLNSSSLTATRDSYRHAFLESHQSIWFSMIPYRLVKLVPQYIQGHNSKLHSPNFSVRGLRSYLKVKMDLKTWNHNFVILMFKGQQSLELNI